MSAVEQHGNGPVLLGMSLGQVIVCLAWPVLLLVAGYAFLLAKKSDVEMLEEAVRARPAIKVVDVTAVMRAYVGQGLSADQAITEANASFQRLGKAGYVVIDQNAVLAAPESAQVTR